MTKLINKLRKDKSGASAAEYALIISLIAVAIIGSVRLLGTNMDARFSQVANDIGMPAP